MKIAIVGSGYVGITTGTCLAKLGHDVCCLDLNRERITMLQKGVLPIYEPGLDIALNEMIGSGRMHFSADTAEAVQGAHAVFIAVGTPSGADGSIDLSQVFAAGRSIAPHLMAGTVVVMKSTVVAGTAQSMREIIARERGAFDVRVASNPEFLREGSAIKDFMEPDRIVLGADDPYSMKVLRKIYAPFVKEQAPIVETRTINAELIKYAANAFLALKIGFINEVADLCENSGGDVSDVARGIGLDTRIGAAFLQPGPGYGGSCFPKDTRAFASTGREYGARQHLVEALISRNDERKKHLAQRIIREGSLNAGQRVAVLGLAFKANTDDVREAASLSIIPHLQERGLEVAAHDPKALQTASEHLAGVSLHEDAYDCCRGADAVVILTEWEEYRALDLRRLRGLMVGDHLFDYRNLLEPSAASEAGLRLVSLGRVSAAPASRKGVAPIGSWDRRVAAPEHI
ncbi:UDP-glucose dehydrogenase family protein [Nitratireductor basaltis]|uniref:UDP-glucose 6-dehydrogenase n=1 Tax=Nitratireductor basaltis TaxID=472175 RepID=A0A084UAU3_9HYPH|nr:UDP-glucose/GDP-mannose dehydrogenase family protein [Nitratireductor basaltis]KFB10079.1 UDP-glucose/GDP-mannose dehydrogenase [Nitratireductor basaltis]